MPNLHLTKEQIRALTTFLLGSQENPLPANYQYRPLDYRRDIQDGWWVVKKYNCMGCHQLISGQKTSFMAMARYQDAQEQLPPKLLTEGARVDPEWLLRFLKNPALNDKDNDRNGVRSYLQVRMPTFSFSENELAKLVRFFQALSRQPFPYIPEEIPCSPPRKPKWPGASSAAPQLLSEVPRHRRPGSRSFRHCSKLPASPWTSETRLGGTLDYRPAGHQPGHFHAFRSLQARERPLVFSGPTPASFRATTKITLSCWSITSSSSLRKNSEE